MTTNDSKFYLPYLSKLVDQYNNTYHHSINKNPYYCWLFCFRWKYWVKLWELLSIKIFLVTFTPKVGTEKYLLSVLLRKLILGHTKLKI